ncbi:hypothetical protein EEW87_16695 [Janibacter melonis]|uniref:Uncharacterized protein n=1 Tax=Janibacter melonis TaxID=262209 RepID=A0A650GES0_9MICO|nr:hypothetical protein [Janibacter melonis]QGX08455.1 hypothetical protein EEW87_16695 [Janibacter melonis]
MRACLSETGRLRVVAGLAILLVGVLVSLLIMQSDQQQDAEWSPPAGLGSYGAPLLTEDGRMDISGTVEALKETGVDRYYYLIPDRQHLADRLGGSVPTHLGLSDWEDLPRFAEEAAEADIEVVVYLVPPLQSGPGTYRPYGWDYVAWFRAIGKVAAAHPNIVAIAIDDLGSATDLRADDGIHLRFAPADLVEMRAAARAEAPRLDVLGVMYGQDFAGDTATFPRFRNVLDGVIYAFAGPRQVSHAPQNTTDPEGVIETTRFIRSVSSCQTSDPCWQVTFPASTHGPGEEGAAQITHGVEIPGRPGKLSMTFLDNAPPDQSRQYSISISLDGRALVTRRIQQRSASVLMAEVPDDLAGHRTLTIRVHRAASPRGVAVVLDQVSLDGAAPLGLTPNGPWTRQTSGAASMESVSRVPLIGMFYTARLGVEQDSPGAADAPYVRAVTGDMAQLVREGALDGLVAYRLNFSGSRAGPLVGDPRNLGVVDDLYASLRASRSLRRRGPSPF